MIQDLIESEQKKRKTPTCGFMSLEEIPRKFRKYFFTYEGWKPWEPLLHWLFSILKNQVLALQFCNLKKASP